MKQDDGASPDFAMLRAVEIVADLAVKNRETPVVPPPSIDGPALAERLVIYAAT